MPTAPSFNYAAVSDETKLGFFAAAERGDLEALRQALRAHPHAAAWTKPVRDGDMPFARDETALMLAAHGGHADAMRLLLASGAEVDAQQSRGWTSLHIAAWHGHAEAVDVLLWHRAHPALPNEGGHTPATLAFQGGYNDLGRKISGAVRLYGLHAFREGLKKPLSAPKTAKFGR